MKHQFEVCKDNCILFLKQLVHLSYRAHWKKFINGLQRTLIFTPDVGVIDQIQAGNSYSVPQLEVSLSLRAVGLSLVDIVHQIIGGHSLIITFTCR